MVSKVGNPSTGARMLPTGRLKNNFCQSTVLLSDARFDDRPRRRFREFGTLQSQKALVQGGGNAGSNSNLGTVETGFSALR